jgi:putative sigma-54 modulation protein
MAIHISGNNITIGPDLEAFATRKLDRLHRFLPHISDIWLDLSQKNTRRGDDMIKAQITVRHNRGALLRSEVRVQGEPQIAINLALDKMYQQIMRFKGKRSPKGRERFSATADELSIAEALPVFGEDGVEIDYARAEEAAQETSVARHKQIELVRMSEQEAIEQMELLAHTFFVFQDDATGSVNVLYRRQDGSYGVLVPVTAK